jgi:hypothetical protein
MTTFSADELAAITYWLKKLAPHLASLALFSFSTLDDDDFSVESVTNIWSKCPFPIREYIFENGPFLSPFCRLIPLFTFLLLLLCLFFLRLGLLKNTTRGSATDSNLRLSFLWSLVGKNRSIHTSTPILQLLGLVMQFHQSADVRQQVLSKLRLSPSRPTVNKILAEVAESETVPLPQGWSWAFAFDNHQQKRSMGSHHLQGAI